MSEIMECEVAILGSGAGGYTAAFRAADLGKKVLLIEKEDKIGGVCLNVGCIPSKTLLHAAEIIHETEKSISYGISFNKPSIDISVLLQKKDEVINKLTSGVKTLAKARKVPIIKGTGCFSSANTIEVTQSTGPLTVKFEHAVIAVGSHPVELPFLPNDDKRIWDSTDALAIPFIPKRLAVLGGGIIGLEMAEIYSALGSEIVIIEMLDQIIPPADSDLVRPLTARLKETYKAIYTSTKLTAVEAHKKGLKIMLEGSKAPKDLEVDALLVAVGRRPKFQDLGLEVAGVQLDSKGFVAVDKKMQTSAKTIYAIGDAVGNPMLAHKATHEGKIAAEVIAGHKAAFTPMCIPSVAYTNPEIAWVGYTEKEAKAEGLNYKKGVFPWSASGRALAADKALGFSKALFDPESGRIIGAGIVGARASDLIIEAGLAIEMGADAADIGSTVHPHPTFSETLALAAEMVEGTITDALPKK